MILCSKIAFLNVLTQLMDYDTLLGSTYYTPDAGIMAQSRGRAVNLGETYKFDASGSLVQETTNLSGSTMTQFNIYSYCPTLDPLVFSNHIAFDIAGANTQEEIFINSLKTDDSLLAVYKWFVKQVPDNDASMRILLYENHKTLWRYGAIIADYMSSMFGFDVIYIDRIYNPHIPGNKMYSGNAENAKRLIEYLSKKEIEDQFNNVNTLFGSGELGSDEPLNNLNTLLYDKNFPELLRIYQTLFPNEPLPAGNYTETRMREIITGKLIERNRHIFANDTYDDDDDDDVPFN